MQRTRGDDWASGITLGLVDGATVVLIVESLKAADFDGFLADAAQPVLDGLTWN